MYAIVSQMNEMQRRALLFLPLEGEQLGAPWYFATRLQHMAKRGFVTYERRFNPANRGSDLAAWRLTDMGRECSLYLRLVLSVFGPRHGEAEAGKDE